MATPAKRVRRSRGTRSEEDVLQSPSSSLEAKAGALLRLELLDFMSHARLKLNFGSRLNVVCGSNGSGKSAMLQAIVLGLGGHAKDTKRMSNLKGFIRHGFPKAEVSGRTSTYCTWPLSNVSRSR